MSLSFAQSSIICKQFFCILAQGLFGGLFFEVSSFTCT